MVTAVYSCRDAQGGLVEHREELASPRDLQALFARYPWQNEYLPLERDEAGGGLFFQAGNSKRRASYQFVPFERGLGWLHFEAVLKPGLFGWLGRRAVFVDFDRVSTSEAKHRIRELFDCDIETLFERHRDC
ncbi:hypothetical protein [Salinisphaera sp. Q1T1-3]|uniref:hypothetical protein n=1 Tax=Salinisphaera sp. Q1T1-3 TaxID=2321229 RepID=UPI000E7307DA|nr:hypothetical protein [Salinisphaera sp. Q1T1-3]RJS94833.1 hypothetical protein D3260_03445 [Salinisphaera sp. Q1T1-3]